MTSAPLREHALPQAAVVILALLPLAVALLVGPETAILLGLAVLLLPLLLVSPASALAGVTLLTVFPLPGSQAAAKGLAAILLLSLALRAVRDRQGKLFQKSNFLAPIAVLLSVTALGITYSPDSAAGIERVVSLGSLAILFLAARTVAAEDRGLRYFGGALLLGGTLLAPLALTLGGGSAGSRIDFLYRNPNSLGQACSLLLALAVSVALHARRLRVRLYAAASAAALLAALLATGSRGAYLATCVALAVLVARKWGIRGLASCGAGLAVLLLAALAAGVRPSDIPGRLDADAGRRLATTTVALRSVARHPVLGVGTGGFATTVRGPESWRLHGSRVLGDPHNELLRLLVENGVSGALAFVYLVWCFLRLGPSGGGAARRALGDGARAGLAGFFLNSFLHGGLHFNLFWLVLALAEATAVAEKPRDAQPASPSEGAWIGS